MAESFLLLIAWSEATLVVSGMPIFFLDVDYVRSDVFPALGRLHYVVVVFFFSDLDRCALAHVDRKQEPAPDRFTKASPEPSSSLASSSCPLLSSFSSPYLCNLPASLCISAGSPPWMPEGTPPPMATSPVGSQNWPSPTSRSMPPQAQLGSPLLLLAMDTTSDPRSAMEYRPPNGFMSFRQGQSHPIFPLPTPQQLGFQHPMFCTQPPPPTKHHPLPSTSDPRTTTQSTVKDSQKWKIHVYTEGDGTKRSAPTPTENAQRPPGTKRAKKATGKEKEAPTEMNDMKEQIEAFLQAQADTKVQTNEMMELQSRLSAQKVEANRLAYEAAKERIVAKLAEERTKLFDKFTQMLSADTTTMEPWAKEMHVRAVTRLGDQLFKEG
ncbi:hypothetical protein D1007_29106 [Hordeum vulgare]|nr:hypothetical protein D1007_29106 [Hordeum vulgare]